MAEHRTGKHRLCREHIPVEAMEHAHAAREEIRKSIEALLPAGFIEHRRAARREMLEAVRSIINGALEQLEERQT